MSISEKLLPEFDHEFTNTRKFLALVPDDELAWKPHAKSMEMGRLAWHISDLAGRASDVLTQNTRVVSLEDMAKRRNAWVAKTRADILEHFDNGSRTSREAIAVTSDAGWHESWKFVFNGQTIFDGPRSVAYRAIVMSHQIHHRAQFGLYLRLNDIAIPGVYGPSADEM